MASLTIPFDFSGCGDSGGHTPAGDVSWSPTIYGEPYAGNYGGGFSGGEQRSVFRTPYQATLVGATITALDVYLYELGHVGIDFYTHSLYPYHTNGLGDPVADAASSYSTSWGYATVANQYITGITAFRSGDSSYNHFSLPSQAITDFSAAVAASSYWTLCFGLDGSTFGNNFARIAPHTDANYPYIVVTYTPAAGGSAPSDRGHSRVYRQLLAQAA